MPTTPEYDAILARKIREREEGNKREAAEILVKGLTQACGDNSDVTYKDGTLTIMPKKRGRPKGSKNKPKVK